MSKVLDNHVTITMTVTWFPFFLLMSVHLLIYFQLAFKRLFWLRPMRLFLFFFSDSTLWKFSLSKLAQNLNCFILKKCDVVNVVFDSDCLGVIHKLHNSMHIRVDFSPFWHILSWSNIKIGNFSKAALKILLIHNCFTHKKFVKSYMDKNSNAYTSENCYIF